MIQVSVKTGTQPPLLLKISNKIQVHEHLLSAHGGSEGKASACNEGSIPGSGRSPGEGSGNPLRYSCLENLMDGEAWSIGSQDYSPLGRKESDTTEGLHFHFS